MSPNHPELVTTKHRKITYLCRVIDSTKFKLLQLIIKDRIYGKREIDDKKCRYTT